LGTSRRCCRRARRGRGVGGDAARGAATRTVGGTGHRTVTRTVSWFPDVLRRAQLGDPLRADLRRASWRPSRARGHRDGPVPGFTGKSEKPAWAVQMAGADRGRAGRGLPRYQIDAGYTELRLLRRHDGVLARSRSRRVPWSTVPTEISLDLLNRAPCTSSGFSPALPAGPPLAATGPSTGPTPLQRPQLGVLLSRLDLARTLRCALRVHGPPGSGSDPKISRSVMSRPVVLLTRSHLSGRLA